MGVEVASGTRGESGGNRLTGGDSALGGGGCCGGGRSGVGVEPKNGPNVGFGLTGVDGRQRRSLVPKMQLGGSERGGIGVASGGM